MVYAGQDLVRLKYFYQRRKNAKGQRIPKLSIEA